LNVKHISIMIYLVIDTFHIIIILHKNCPYDYALSGEEEDEGEDELKD
jgi:hypothetical protein